MKTKKETVKHKIDPDQKITKYKFGDYISKLSSRYYTEWFKQNTNKQNMFLIIMQMRNGKYSMFTIATKEAFFKYQDGEYYIDPDMTRDDVHSGLPVIVYHQDCSAPFKIHFDISKLRNALATEAKDVEKAINPQNLRSFIHSQVIEKVLKGQELSDDIKFLRMMVIIIALIVGGIAFMFAKSMGYI